MCAQKLLAALIFLLAGSLKSHAQVLPELGPNDTILVSAIIIEDTVHPYSTLPEVYVSKLPPEQLARVLQEYNRLRNAVYVTYPYARRAGAVLQDVQRHLNDITSKSERKKYIKSREADLRKQFADPLSNLSVYQGKVLMKLINRQAGQDCYELIKEYRGGLNARMYQTVAFFFGSSLRQEYLWQEDPTDRQIEAIVKEIDGSWYNNPNKPGIKN